MIFAVVWTPYADERLANGWLESSDREGVNNAAAWIIRQLRHDPRTKGIPDQEIVLFWFRACRRLVRNQRRGPNWCESLK